MYITYCRNQKTVDLEDKTTYRLNVTGGEYRPTWLIRVSDWKRVPGTEAVNGYHTISYCWEQSGEVVKNETDGEYHIVDDGKHCIVEGYKVYEDKIFELVDRSDTDDDQDDNEKSEKPENSLYDKEDDNEVNQKDDHQNACENEFRDVSDADEEDVYENDYEDGYDANKDDKESNSENDCQDNADVSEVDYQKSDEEKDKKDTSKDASDADKEEKTIDYKQYVLWCEPVLETTTLRYVTYDKLLQQVCKDFQVEYVWYDKICIDQSDPKAKSREIKQMHKIYRDARYMIAMIPEVCIYNNPEEFEQTVHGSCHKAHGRVILDTELSCWFKRSWTLEEVMMTRRILIVGTNTNMFQHSLNTTGIPTTKDVFSRILLDFGAREENDVNVNQALAFAHFRTSTKPHDMIYALKNTFSHMFDDIEVSYSTDIKTVFNDFYRHVATDDISILCFGSNNYLCGATVKKSSIDSYNLPSWTGVSGMHVHLHTSATIHPQLSHYIDNTMWMHIITKYYWKIGITPYDSGRYSLSKNMTEEWGSTIEKYDSINYARADGNWTDMATADKDTVLMEWFVNIHSVICRYMTHYHQPKGCLLSQIRPLTLTEDCKECIILPILFEIRSRFYKRADGDIYNCTVERYGKDYFLPVLRECTKGTGRYRAIGIYHIGDDGTSNQPTFQWNHYIGRDDIDTDDPKEILNMLFEKDSHNVPKEFIIE